MKLFLLSCGAVITIAGACLGFAQDEAKSPPPPPKEQAEKSDAKPETKTPADAEKPDTKSDGKAEKKAEAISPAAKAAAAADDDSNTKNNIPSKYAADEEAIREVHDKLLQAYCADDAKAVAEQFSEEGEYINAAGELFQGRDDIQSTLDEFMQDHPGCSVESEITALRFLGPSLALANGTFTVKHTSDTEHAEETGPVSRSKFNAVYSKTDGKWQIASIRDHASKDDTSHEDHLAVLDFLQGEWIDEDQESSVTFTCQAIDGGKFLSRDFVLNVGGREVMSGSQRIGWDPLSGKLRTWIFDSEGGFAEGTWHQQGDNEWIVRAAGVTSDGRVASGTSVYKLINNHTMTWQSIDYEVDGTPVEDSPVFTLTHRAPSPGEEPAEPRVSQKP